MKQLMIDKGSMKFIKEKVNMSSFDGFLLYFCLFCNRSSAMKKNVFSLWLLLLLTVGAGLPAAGKPSLWLSTEDSLSLHADQILQKAYLVDDYIRLVKHPDYWANTVVDGKSRPSNIWTRGVFYEGHLALWTVSPDSVRYHYAYDWADYHQWQVAYKDYKTTSADNQCCGQTYLELYCLDPSPNKLTPVQACLDYSIQTHNTHYWTWIDAIQMAMPIYARLGNITGNATYWTYMDRSYRYTRDTIDGTGLFNPADGLWWRDKNFNTPYVNKNGKNVYWSRGNGWVYAALVRVLSLLPATAPHFSDYLNDYLIMSNSLIACQREDGFWNPSLVDTNEYGGKETSGTALFTYGLCWGLNQGYLPPDSFLIPARKAWAAISREAIHDNGFIGWTQGTGDDPSDGQPLSYDKVPNFEDFGAGCVLLAAAESYKLALRLEKVDSLVQSRPDIPFNQTFHLNKEAGRIHIEGPANQLWMCYDLSGRLMVRGRLSSAGLSIIDSSTWPKGTYIVHLSSNQSTHSQLFVL
jgi:rhamnogalacturonyl hydrolase YesR